MVLTRPGWLCVLACAACSQSLFDAHGPGGGGGGGDDGGGTIPTSCPDPCVADAAKDFNGSASGTNQRWRYLDDHRDRTWTAMAAAGNQMTGADMRNRITTCSASAGAAACSTLPGALLISSAGATAPADPAIEFTVPSAQVLQLTVRVHVPGTADQQVILYRGSREDALYRATATVGNLLEHTIKLYDYAWLFSDTDYDLGGGLAVALFVPDPPDAPQVLATTCTDPDAPAFTDSLGSYPNDGMAWHFVRVVHTGGMMNVCVDGKKVASAAIADDQLKSVSLPHLGKNGKWLPVGGAAQGRRRRVQRDLPRSSAARRGATRAARARSGSMRPPSAGR